MYHLLVLVIVVMLPIRFVYLRFTSGFARWFIERFSLVLFYVCGCLFFFKIMDNFSLLLHSFVLLLIVIVISLVSFSLYSSVQGFSSI